MSGYGFIQKQGEGTAQSTGTLGNSIFSQSKPKMSGAVVGGAAGSGKVSEESLFQVEEKKLDPNNLVDRNADTWAGRYKGLVNLVYHDEDVSGYQGSGVHGDGPGSYLNDNVKVPVARVTGGVVDKTTGKLNPYGKIVVGKMYVGPEQIPIDLDLNPLEQQVDRLNQGHTTADQRIQNALASLDAPSKEDLAERRQVLEERSPEMREENVPAGGIPDFDTLMKQANIQAKQNIQQQQAAVPQAPAQPIYHQPAPQQPVAQQPPPQAQQPDLTEVISQVIASMQQGQKQMQTVAEPDPQAYPLSNTDDVRVIMDGFFGKPKITYKHYEKQDNMLILMYTINDNIYTPPKSNQEFSMRIEKKDGTAETYNSVFFMGVEFEIKALGLGFQVYFVE